MLSLPRIRQEGLIILFYVCRVARVHPRRTKMCTNKYNNSLPKILILGVESLIIILANIATVVVFWKRRSQLKQTCFILINLTVADLMVGFGIIEDVVNEIWKLLSSSCTASWEKYVVLNEIFGGASITFLALISLERLYAIVWPFRIRTTSRGKYICSGGSVAYIGTFSCCQTVTTVPGCHQLGWDSVLVCLLNNHVGCIFCDLVLLQKERSQFTTKQTQAKQRAGKNTVYCYFVITCNMAYFYSDWNHKGHL